MGSSLVEILSRPAAEDPRVSKQHNGKVNGMLFYQTFDAAGVSNAFKRMIRQIWSQRTYRLLSGRFTRENGAVLVPGSTLSFQRSEIYKHYFYIFSRQVAALPAPSQRANYLRNQITNALELFEQIQAADVFLDSDSDSSYLPAWLNAIAMFERNPEWES